MTLKSHLLTPLYAVQNIVATVLKVRVPEIILPSPLVLNALVGWELYQSFTRTQRGTLEQHHLRFVGIWTPTKGLVTHGHLIEQANLNMRQDLSAVKILAFHVGHLHKRPNTVGQAVEHLLQHCGVDSSACLVLEQRDERPRSIDDVKRWLVPLDDAHTLFTQNQHRFAHRDEQFSYPSTLAA